MFRIHVGAVWQGKMNVSHVPDTCGGRLAGKNECFSCSGYMWGPFGKEKSMFLMFRMLWSRGLGCWLGSADTGGGYQSLISLSKMPSRVPLEPFFGTMNFGGKFMFRIHVPVHGLGCWCPFCR